jgi:hypothetical protein
VLGTGLVLLALQPDADPGVQNEAKQNEPAQNEPDWQNEPAQNKPKQNEPDPAEQTHAAKIQQFQSRAIPAAKARPGGVGVQNEAKSNP